MEIISIRNGAIYVFVFAFIIVFIYIFIFVFVCIFLHQVGRIKSGTVESLRFMNNKIKIIDDDLFE